MAQKTKYRTQKPFRAGAHRLSGMAAAVAAVLAVMAGCAKAPSANSGDDAWIPLSGESPMRFVSNIYDAQTKADPTVTALAGGSFGVFAFLQEGDVANGTVAHWADAPGDGKKWTSAFMFNVPVTYTGEANSTEASEYKDHGNYSYSPLRYWPSNVENTISFWAYYPATLPDGFAGTLAFRENGTESTYTNASKTGLPDVYFKTDLAHGVDLMFDSFTNKDLTYETCPKDINNVAAVPMHFSHALSQVTFKVKKDTGMDGIVVTLNSVTVHNLLDSGTWSSNAATPDWTLGTTTADWAVSSTDITVPTDAADVATSFPLPQALPNEGSRIVTVDINYSIAGTAMPTVTMDLKMDDITAWAKNGSYVYTIVISKQKLYIVPTVAPWVDATELTYTLNLNTNMRLFDSWLYRYDTDGNYDNPNDWATSHMAVSSGRGTATATEHVAGRPLRSPQIQLVTTGEGDFHLKVDNSDFEIVRANKNTAGVVTSYDASVNGVLNIAAGTDVYTYFYIVPKEGVTPSSPEAKVTLIYDDPVTGAQKVTFNYSSLPGYSDDSSEIWVWYFPEEQYNNNPGEDDKRPFLKMYFQDVNNPLVPTTNQN